MTPWLRLIVVAVTVGGGFTGVSIALKGLLAAHGQPPAYYVLIVGFLVLYAFVTVSGLVFVHDPKRIRLLIVAFALQVPWISSPLVAYKFSAGFQVGAAFIGGHFNVGAFWGSDFQINFFQRLPWGVGANVFPLALLILLIRTTEGPTPSLEPTAVPGGEVWPSKGSVTVSSSSGTPPPGDSG